jgi:hypothetical protein
MNGSAASYWTMYILSSHGAQGAIWRDRPATVAAGDPATVRGSLVIKLRSAGQPRYQKMCHRVSA